MIFEPNALPLQACSSVGYRLAYGIGEPTAKFLRTRLEAEGRAGGGTLVWIGAERSEGESWKWSSGKRASKECLLMSSLLSSTNVIIALSFKMSSLNGKIHPYDRCNDMHTFTFRGF